MRGREEERCVCSEVEICALTLLKFNPALGNKESLLSVAVSSLLP